MTEHKLLLKQQKFGSCRNSVLVTHVLVTPVLKGHDIKDDVDKSVVVGGCISQLEKRVSKSPPPQVQKQNSECKCQGKIYWKLLVEFGRT